MNDYLERRIATLERVVFPLPRLVQNLGIKLGQVDQQIQGIRSGGYGCNTIVTGKVIGNPVLATAVPGVSMIQVLGHTTAIDYGTYATASDGTFSISLPSIDPADGTTLDFFVTGPTARFGTSSAQARSGIALCTTTAIANLGAVAATGYIYLAGVCNYPLKTTLSWTETVLGSGTVTGAWSGCFPYTTLATTGCPTPIATNVQITLSTNLFYTLAYPRSGVGGCPVVRTCALMNTGSLGASASQPFSLATAHTCPDATNLFSISWTYSVTNDPVLGTGSRTMTFFET